MIWRFGFKKRFLGSEIRKSHCLFLFLKIDKKWVFKKQPFFEIIFSTSANLKQMLQTRIKSGVCKGKGKRIRAEMANFQQE